MERKTDLMAIKADFDTLKEGVAAIRIGDTDGLRAVNERLGYNIVKSIPGLLNVVEASEKRADGLQAELKKALVTIKDRDTTIQDMKKHRPVSESDES